jgi:hypothetical protein
MRRLSSGDPRRILFIRWSEDQQGGSIVVDGRGGRGRDGRRSRDGPLNPFAPNAGAERNRRREAQQKRQREADAQQQRAGLPRHQGGDATDELRRRQVEAKAALSDDTNKVEVPTSVPVSSSAAVLPSAKQKATGESDLDKLRRMSAESAQTAQSIIKASGKPEQTLVVIEEQTSTVTAAVSVVDKRTAHVIDEDHDDLDIDPETISAGQSNVFKTITVDKQSRQVGQRRKGSREKKGGGRQKQVRKLNRQKYLEYKYAAREILAHDGVAEEHRSNVLGQVWAKGERISLEAAIAFVEEKEGERVLPPDVAAELLRLLRRMDTRR